jgi:hypothetical protein
MHTWFLAFSIFWQSTAVPDEGLVFCSVLAGAFCARTAPAEASRKAAANTAITGFMDKSFQPAEVDEPWERLAAVRLKTYAPLTE